jgi:hypothetical protein
MAVTKPCREFLYSGDDNMRNKRQKTQSTTTDSFSLNTKLASYLAASASIGAAMASEAKAVVVSNNTVQNVGINGFANIDFNHDGQTDYQIDHDRVDLTPQGGPVVDYLQLDKNDVNGASPGEDLFKTDFTQNFPTNGTTGNANINFGYVVQHPASSSSVEYPSALLAGAEIGPNQSFDFQEGDNVYGNNVDPPKTGRFNRLIDEDHGQVDTLLNPAHPMLFTPTGSPQFVGVQNLTRYLGVKMDLNATGQINYGWIGIKITNEADATGQVVGYGYETQPGVAILAGAQAPGIAGDYNNDGKVDAKDYVIWKNGSPLQNETVTPGSNTIEDYNVWRASFGNHTGSGAGLASGASVPEPGSLLLSMITGLGLIAAYFCRRFRGR